MKTRKTEREIPGSSERQKGLNSLRSEEAPAIRRAAPQHRPSQFPAARSSRACRQIENRGEKRDQMEDLGQARSGKR